VKQLLVLLAAAVVVGCQQPAPEPEPPPAASELPRAPAPSPGVGIRFEYWPTATERPIPIDPAFFADCAPYTYVGQEQEAGRKRHGPHHAPSIVVRVNPEAIEAFRAGLAPLPAGTTVVKEKHPDLAAKNPPAEYGAMIKREPGYDAAHGDWEYVFVTRGAEKMVTRGRIESCIDCHAHVKEKDYLFRTYLPGQAGAVPGW
jgi:hypothetical protein